MKAVFTKKDIFEFAQMVLGNAICAFSITCFALPYNMVVGGAVFSSYNYIPYFLMPFNKGFQNVKLF